MNERDVATPAAVRIGPHISAHIIPSTSHVNHHNRPPRHHQHSNRNHPPPSHRHHNQNTPTTSLRSVVDRDTQQNGTGNSQTDAIRRDEMEDC